MLRGKTLPAALGRTTLAITGQQRNQLGVHGVHQVWETKFHGVRNHMAMEWVFGAQFHELVTFKRQPGDFTDKKCDNDLFVDLYQH